jgi:hypothetical protein
LHWLIVEIILLSGDHKSRHQENQGQFHLLNVKWSNYRIENKDNYWNQVELKVISIFRKIANKFVRNAIERMLALPWMF